MSRINNVNEAPSYGLIMLVAVVGILVYLVSNSMGMLIVPWMLTQPSLVPITGLIDGLIVILVSYILFKLMLQYIIKEPAEHFGFGTFSLNAKWVLVSFAMPLTVILIYLFFIEGKMIVQDFPISIQLNHGLNAIFSTGLATGYIEEIIFRGFLQVLLERRVGRWPSFWIISIVFALLHTVSPSYSLTTVVLIIIVVTLVSLVFTLAYWESGSLYNAMLVHAVWNALLIGPFFQITSRPHPDLDYNYVVNSEQLLINGGEQGVEATIVSMFVILFFGLISYRLYLRGKMTT